MQLDLSNKPLARSAYDLAWEHHRGITRKYTGEDYLNHPVRVAETLLRHKIFEDEVLAAALLHDCHEDENLAGEVMSLETIQRHCGTTVSRYVEALSCPPIKNRERRKAIYNDKLRQAHWHVKAIKCADIIDNMKGLVEHDPDFAEKYIAEKDEQLKALQNFHCNDKAILLVAEMAIRRERNAFALTILNQGRELEARRKADDDLVEQLAREHFDAELLELAIF